MASLAIIRAVHFASLMAIFGAETLHAIFRASLEQSPPRPSARWLTLCAAAALISALLWLWLVAATLLGDDSMDIHAVGIVVQKTLFGRVMLARIALLGLLLGTMVFSRAALPRIVLSAGALAAVSLTSHAAAVGDDDFLLLRAGNDAVHLLAAAFWVGSLAALVPVVIAQRHSLAALAPGLRQFSFWGTIAVSLLVAAGALNTYFILFSTHARWSAGYVGLLALKITLAAVMVSLALVNRFHLLPAIEEQRPESAENLITSSVMELAVGALIVIAVSVLGTMSPALT